MDSSKHVGTVATRPRVVGTRKQKPPRVHSPGSSAAVARPASNELAVRPLNVAVTAAPQPRPRALPRGPIVPTRDDITAEIRALSADAAVHGRETGIARRVDVFSEQGAPLGYVAIERYEGHWGLYYTDPGTAGAPKKVPLVDARFAIREWFLLFGKAFYGDYLASCEQIYSRRRFALNEGATMRAMSSAVAIPRTR